MKYLLFLPPALLLGLVIGGWAPKEELRSAKKEVADLSQKLASREKDSRMDAFTRMVQIPDRAQKVKPAPRPSPRPEAPPAPADAALQPAATNAPADAAPQGAAHPPWKKERELTPEDLRARIDEAKELWKTRVEIARAQWIDRLKLTPEAAALFDDSINAMNENLYLSMQNLAATLENAESLTPELGTRFFNEMTSSLVQTYDDLNAIVPEGQLGEAAKIELTDFIDPAVAEPLIAVQDKLENMPGPGGQRGFRRPR